MMEAGKCNLISKKERLGEGKILKRDDSFDGMRFEMKIRVSRTGSRF